MCSRFPVALFIALAAVAPAACDDSARSPADAAADGTDADRVAPDGDVDAQDADDDGNDGDVADRPIRIGTWNLHNFSVYGTDEWRIDDVATHLAGLNVDVLAVQEIKVEEGTDGEYPQAWDALLERLPHHDGIHNPWDSFDTTVGLVYDQRTTEILAWQPIFTDDFGPFPRAPLEALVLVSRGGEPALELFVIVVHLKAFADSLDRRRLACTLLDDYIRARPDRRYLVIGDFNDDPYDPPERNAFTDTFLRSADYDFVTSLLPPGSTTSVGHYHSVDGVRITGEFLDHAVLTTELRRELVAVTPFIESVPESEYERFSRELSDHFPVILEVGL